MALVLKIGGLMDSRVVKIDNRLPILTYKTLNRHECLSLGILTSTF